MNPFLQSLLPDRSLVLASTSRYRRKLMDQLGVDYVAAAPVGEEDHGLGLPPEKLVVELAVGKAKSLKQAYPQALIIGSDQVASLDGEILFKPGTGERAKEQLTRLAGKTHQLFTGLAVLDPATSRLETTLDVHHMTIRALTPNQIDAYVELDDPVDCAGAYKVEGRGIALFESMRGEDFSGIIGLPLTKLVTLLKRF
jgi:septum formation protein